MELAQPGKPEKQYNIRLRANQSLVLKRQRIEVSEMLFLSLLALCASTPSSEPVIPYGVSDWPAKFGNHRGVVKVESSAKAIWVHLPWRLPQYDPAMHDIIVMSAGNERVKNVYRARIDDESADLVFQPVGGVSDYYVYYLPYDDSPIFGYVGDPYTKPTGNPDPEWVAVNQVKEYSKLPKAEVLRFEARGEFNRFNPMEVCATAAETDSLKANLKPSYTVFPEDRRFPIRMRKKIPYRWVEKGPAPAVVGEASKNEYFAYQLGVWATDQDLKRVRVEFTDLTNGKDSISKDSMTCYNISGVGFDGKPFTIDLDVPKGQVQALWCGVQIPANAEAGTYRGKVTVSCEGGPSTVIPVEIKVDGKTLKDHGDAEAWRMSRLRWLNSRIGEDDDVVSPYTPLKLNGNTIACLGRSVTLGNDGMPTSIKAGDHEVLSSQIRLSGSIGSKPVDLGQAKLEFTKKASGVVEWTSNSDGRDAVWRCAGSMEFDGHLGYTVEITAKSDLNLENLILQIPFNRIEAEYMMGIGRSGSLLPMHYDWKWTGPYDSFWVGSVHSGLHVELRGGTYHGPMLNLYRPAPPESWSNGGKGGVEIDCRSGCKAQAYTGSRSLRKGETLKLEFALIVTPVKPFDLKKHFSTRYYHSFPGPTTTTLPSQEAIEAGVNVVNLHQATEYNPYINYPLVAADLLKPVVRDLHAKSVKTKIYYTIRELTNYASEFWALRSLGFEIFANGGGGGAPWLREHVVDGYSPAWVSSLPKGEIDAAVTTTGLSRWCNFYVEGLKWMSENVGIDGLYLDDVSYDRTVLKRMRKVMERANPGSLFDLHSNTAFSIGPANQYLEFFPYIDRLWFGESFNYEAMSPEQYLIEVSGLPFGLGGEMLQNGGNLWRGALYGMTNRYGWITENTVCDPRPVWRIWDEFGIADSEMIGYWEKACPVRTNNKDVLATVYKRKGRALIALASWAPTRVGVKLLIDWKALGIDSSKARLSAPVSSGFQPSADFALDETIPVEPGKGWMLILKER